MNTNMTPKIRGDEVHRATICAHERSLLVKAEAGGGKTAVMVAVVTMMLASGIPPASIPLVTIGLYLRTLLTCFQYSRKYNMSQQSTPCVIVHVPHASLVIPVDVRDQFVINDVALALELDRLTDHYTDELFSYKHQCVETVHFPVNRFVVDPERYIDDTQEPMAEKGQGVVYTKTTEGSVLRRQLEVGERTSLLERYYVPHHRALTTATERALSSLGVATIIDAHSFPDIPLPVDLSQEMPRPDICLGTDTVHTPDALLNIVSSAFVESGYSVRINDPYAGTIVPLAFYEKNEQVSSIMIEINRRLYLEGEPGDLRKIADIARLEKTIQRAIEAVIAWTTSRASE